MIDLTPVMEMEAYWRIVFLAYPGELSRRGFYLDNR